MATTETQELVYTGKDGQITSFRLPNFQHSALGMLILYRLINNRDLKVIITSKGSTTGTGKTTLAIILCRWIRAVSNDIFDTNISWNALEYGFVELRDYLEAYRHANPGDALLIDEIEYSADRRRSMTHENVGLTQAWSILRYKNVVSIATLPTVSMVDQRLMELADVWINVQMRGRANTYYLTIDDFTNELIRKRLKYFGYRESIIWDDLDDSDNDFQHLEDRKKEIGIPGLDDRDNVSKQDVKDAKTKTRQNVAVELLKLKQEGIIDLTQAQIGDIVDYSQESIARLKRKHL